MDKQIKMPFAGDEMAESKTRKKTFLAKIDRIIPWEELKGLVKPCYYEGKRGNKPYGLELMLRIYLLQEFFSLSDLAVKNEIVDSRALSEFCGLEFVKEVPDSKTIGRFRKLLEKYALAERIKETVKTAFASAGYTLRPGNLTSPTLVKKKAKKK